MLKKQKLIGSLLIAAGAMILAVSCLSGNSILLFSLAFVVFGAGSGILFSNSKAAVRQPNDERQIMLREKAGQITNGITFVILSVFTLVLASQEIATWVVAVVGFTALLQIVLMGLFQHLLSGKY